MKFTPETRKLPPDVMIEDKKRMERLARFAKVDLYPVTCEKLSRGRSDVDVLEGMIAGGARIVQLRDKVSSKGELFHKAVEFRRITAESGVLLILNDHVDIAMAVDADGVHLGQNDFPLEAARELIPDKIIGLSCHKLVDAVWAKEHGADYFNIGPIYPTETKEGITYSLGSEIIPSIISEVRMPFTVMGGIKKENIPELLAAGASKIALVTAVTQAPDIAAAVLELRNLINPSNA